MARYIKVSPLFYAQHQGAKCDCNVLNCILTTGGFYVCSENTKNEFPELFTGEEEVIELDVSNFPDTNLN